MAIIFLSAQMLVVFIWILHFTEYLSFLQPNQKQAQEKCYQLWSTQVIRSNVLSNACLMATKRMTIECSFVFNAFCASIFCFSNSFRQDQIEINDKPSNVVFFFHFIKLLVDLHFHASCNTALVSLSMSSRLINYIETSFPLPAHLYAISYVSSYIRPLRSFRKTK